MTTVYTTREELINNIEQGVWQVRPLDALGRPRAPDPLSQDDKSYIREINDAAFVSILDRWNAGNCWGLYDRTGVAIVLTYVK